MSNNIKLSTTAQFNSIVKSLSCVYEQHSILTIRILLGMTFREKQHIIIIKMLIYYMIKSLFY